MIYVVMRGRAVLSVHDTERAATAAAEGPNMRVEARTVRRWWLRPADSPHYVLLPRADYVALRQSWRLP